MDLIIVSPTKNQKYINLYKITLPSLNGDIQILQNHAETFVLLDKGSIVFEKKNGYKHKISIDKSICHIRDNVVNIII